MRLRIALGAAAAAFALVATPASAAQRFNDLYVFGDSLVDAGNVFAARGGTIPPAALGYFEGRFTNGYNYVDYLGRHIDGRVTEASLTGGNNFAYGGARVVGDTVDAIPDLELQLAAWKAANGGVADPNALYVLNAGANDVFQINEFLRGDPTRLNPIGNLDDYKAAVIDGYAQSVVTLNALGARNILITGIPNVTDPIGRELEGLLQARLDTLDLAEGTNLFRYSYFDFFTRLATDPGSFGLPPLDTSTSCIAAGAQATGCVGLFSFDGVHPTAAVQRALFEDINAQFNLAEVPEPETWAMMIAGFGMVGFAMRRQQRVRVACG